MNERAQRVKKKIENGGNYFSKPKTDIKFIHSGSKLLDLALGGGFAENRIANIIGNASSGKTQIAIEVSANFARKYPNGRIFYREAEAAFLPNYAAALGMPLNRIDFGVKPLETIEDMFTDLNDCVQTAKKHPSLYICDSLDALSDQAELEREFGEGSYGVAKAKYLSKMFRILVGKMANNNITLIIISQIRDKIGVMYGEKTARTGGRALDFYASQVIHLDKIGSIEKTTSGIKRVTGINVRAKVKKNKISLPFREAEFSIMFGYGLNDENSCIDWLKKANGISELTKDPKDYIKQLEKMNDSDYRKELNRLHLATEKRWYEVETNLLPSRRKYLEDQK